MFQKINLQWTAWDFFLWYAFLSLEQWDRSLCPYWSLHSVIVTAMLRQSWLSKGFYWPTSPWCRCCEHVAGQCRLRMGCNDPINHTCALWVCIWGGVSCAGGDFKGKWGLIMLAILLGSNFFKWFSCLWSLFCNLWCSWGVNWSSLQGGVAGLLR